MTAQSGRDFLLKVEQNPGSGSYTTVGGMRSNNLSINGETIDITSKDNNGFRELLSGGGFRTINTSGSGVFVSDAAYKMVADTMLAGAHLNWQICVPSMGVYEGAFAITSLEMSGEFNGEVSYSFSLQSAGEIDFTAA